MINFLHPNISEQDALISSKSIEKLRPYLTGPDRSLVFFVGAGASMAGNSGMPNTYTLIYQLLLDSLTYSKAFNDELEIYKSSLKEISSKLGFEITLNDFWQICREATASLYSDFAELETQCKANRVHTFLANWLATSGTVVTTNYDRLIEKEWGKISPSTKSLYRDNGSNSFSNWKGDLHNGSCLFKIHGSLDEPSTCLGALEHVGTQLTGNRAEFLKEIVQNRPLCFVGWRGVDPDIPPLLRNTLEKRDPVLPIFWIHYEGWPPGSLTLDESINGMTELVRPLTSQNPILTDADRAFGEMLRWLGNTRKGNRSREPLAFDFRSSVNQCTKTGVTRMVGIALRRGGILEDAKRVLEVALELAETNEDQVDVLQEISLLHQQKGGRKTDKSRRYLTKARKALGNQTDPWRQLNTDFGILSQTIVALGNRPWLLFRVPGLFRQYRRDIDLFRQRTNDQETAALHESLYHLYLGRFRFKVFGTLVMFLTPLTDWIVIPFDIARSTIMDAKDINIHSRIDVLAYRAVALGHLGRCEDAKEDVPEIDRLIAIFNDGARTEHWQNQKREFIDQCQKHGVKQ
jgi:NAD-dependent SIR2 family protein deacetylase